MAVASARAPRSLLGLLARDAKAVRERVRASSSPVARHGLTVSALGLFDWAGFSHSLVVGLVVTAVSVILLDHKIQEG